MSNIIKEMDRTLWKYVKRFKKTSSIYNPKRKSITFVKNMNNLKYLENFLDDILVLCPKFTGNDQFFFLFPVYLFPIENENVSYVFAVIHNYINRRKKPKKNIISKRAYIHSDAIIGVHGNTYYDSYTGNRISLKHMGNVIIEDDVDIEALSIVHRAGIDSTILKRNVKVCVMCNVGHNCIVDENTILAPGVMLGGGVSVGKNCYLWQNVVVRSQVKICNNVIIGANSFVNKDITKPGVYVGSPAKYIKPYDKELR